MSELPGLSLPYLAAFLGTGPLTGELIAGGRSNLTYRVSDGTSTWVVRRPPLGHVLATAHDMAREHRVLTALAASDVPVPRTVALGTDAEDVPFYVMEYVDGLILRSAADLDRLRGGGDVTVLGTLARTLATLHQVSPEAVGLGDFGRPSGYLERQVKTWSRQLEASKSRDLPGLEELARRLSDAVPANDRTAIVHGDYRLDNCLLHPALERVNAVLDWEMSTLGDPLTDLANLTMWWDGMRGLDSPVAAHPGNYLEASSDLAMVAYAEAAGWSVDELRSRMRWYDAFAFFKLAGIAEGIHFRNIHGQTVGEGFDRIGEMTVPVIERGLEALGG